MVGRRSHLTLEYRLGDIYDQSSQWLQNSGLRTRLIYPCLSVRKNQGRHRNDNVVIKVSRGFIDILTNVNNSAIQVFFKFIKIGLVNPVGTFLVCVLYPTFF